MNISAIMHINSRYRHCDTYITTNGKVGIRIRTGMEADEVWLVYNDPYHYENGEWKSFRSAMRFGGVVESQKIFSIEVDCLTKRLKYYFLIRSGGETIQYSEMGVTVGYEQKFLPGFFFPYVDDIQVFRQPEWVKNTVWYQIMPARFASTDHSENGTLQGIISKLDYLKELGINGLYLNPIYQAKSYHKYDVMDYTSVDPELGDNEDFARLCREAHARGMKVMLDISFTHCSSENPMWQDVLGKGKDSPYYNWFRIQTDREGLQYETFAFEKGMPKFNTENFELHEFFINKVVVMWMKTAGVDAWRIDVANEISDAMLGRLKSSVRNQNKEGYLLGEIWHNGTEWISNRKLDGVTNYAFSRAVLSFVNSPEHDMQKYRSDINQIIYSYSPEQLAGCMSLLDSHDTQRIRTTFGDDIRKTKLAVFLLLTFYGTPSLYYGAERFMAGGPDPDCRRYPNWDDTTPETADMIAVTGRLIALRQQYHELANDGEFIWWDHDQVLLYERRGVNRFLVVVNCREERQHVHLPLDYGCAYENIVNSDWVRAETEIDAYGFMILKI